MIGDNESRDLDTGNEVSNNGKCGNSKEGSDKKRNLDTTEDVKIPLKVKQDLSKINTTAEFLSEDVKDKEDLGENWDLESKEMAFDEEEDWGLDEEEKDWGLNEEETNGEIEAVREGLLYAVYVVCF